MDQPDLLEPPFVQPDRPRRLRYVVVGAALVFLLAVVAVFGYLLLAAERSLGGAMAEADRLDPGWRLEELLGKRELPPDEQNSALLIVRMKPLWPTPWPAWVVPNPAASPEAERERQALSDSFDELAPPVQLNEQQVRALRTELKRADGVLALAHQLTDLPTGRHPITYSPDWISTLLPTVQDTRQAAALLQYEVWLRAQDRDFEGALRDCGAIVNAGRSLNDEPMLITQLVRIACRGVALRSLERILAQGEAPAAALAAVQQRLEEEDAEPLFLYGVRGERAGSDRLLQMLQSGQFRAPITGLLSGGPQGAVSPMEVVRLRVPGAIKLQRAALLHYLNEAVEIAKLPTEQQGARLADLEQGLPKQAFLVRLLAPAITKTARAFHRAQAEIRCGILLLATERYRLDHGAWPDAPDRLVPAYLARVPLDPFDGAPLRLRPTADGLVIYSVGDDRHDNGGDLKRKAPGEESDLGFHLWNVERRRQPAVPLKMPPAAGAAGPELAP